MLEATLRISQLQRLFSRNQTIQNSQRFQSTHVSCSEPLLHGLMQEYKTPSGRPPLVPIVSTLIPKKLTKEHYVDFREKIVPSIFIPISYTQIGPTYPVGYASIYYTQKGRLFRGSEDRSRNIFNPNLKAYGGGFWPSNAHGFLYYRPNPPGVDHAASCIRLRVTPGNDPADFDKGIDLTYPSGLPWELSIATLITSRRLVALRHLLIAEGLLTEEQIERFEKCNLEGRHFRHNYLYSLDQPFPINFSTRTQRISGFNNGQLVHANAAPWLANGDWNIGRFPIQGDGIAKMETVIDKKGLPAVQIRILKINSLQVDPEYEGRLVTPTEGELLKIKYVNGARPKTYRINGQTGLGPLAALLLNGDSKKFVTADQIKAKQ